MSQLFVSCKDYFFSFVSFSRFLSAKINKHKRHALIDSFHLKLITVDIVPLQNKTSVEPQYDTHVQYSHKRIATQLIEVTERWLIVYVLVCDRLHMNLIRILNKLYFLADLLHTLKYGLGWCLNFILNVFDHAHAENKIQNGNRLLFEFFFLPPYLLSTTAFTYRSSDA